jgi:hypothetical protein
MQQIIKYLLLLLLPILTLANHVHWLGSYKKALTKAQNENKALLVYVIKKDSTLSQKIIKDVLMNKDYVDSINQKMIAVIVSYEGRNTYPVEMYYTTVFPTLFFVNTQTETFMREPMYGEQISTLALLQYFQPLQLKIKLPQH